MKPQTWYAGRLVAPMLGLKEGELVAIRRATQAVPLLVGPVFILFRRKEPLSMRFCESMGVRNVIHLFPNNVNPSQASNYIVNPFGGRKMQFGKLFSTHPPVEERIARLRGGNWR